jgi:peptidoglycan/LPS O-acetylase OafA/YrhL
MNLTQAGSVVDSVGATPERFHALDAVRGYALLLGVVLHSAAAFLTDFPMATWKLEPSTTGAVIYYVIHIFRMSAFYLIAGFFARMVVERRGVKAFVKDRSKRILLPLVVGLPVVVIVTGVGLVLGALPHGTDYLASLTRAPPREPGAAPAGASIDLIHLWFLYYLVIFYVIALALRAAVDTLDPRGAITRSCDKVVAFIMRGVWGPVLLALPIALYYLQHQGWLEWLGLPAPTSLVPNLGALLGYGIAFGLGWLLHRQIPTLLALRNHWLIYFSIAVVLTVLCLTIIGTTPRWRGATIHGSQRAIYAAAYMVAVWCWVFAFVGAAVRFLSEHSARTRYLADASYWIYLMHMAPVIFFISLLRPYHWPWAINFVIMVGGSMPILLLSYHYLVRFTWVGAILNGRRHPLAGKLPPASMASAQ